jgi:ribonuclease-3
VWQVTQEDKLKLKVKEAQLQEIQLKSTMKREVTVELSSAGFLRTGLKSDICQHALLLPVLISHIRFHNCLTVLEKHLQYTFCDRSLLQVKLKNFFFNLGICIVFSQPFRAALRAALRAECVTRVTRQTGKLI